MTCKKNMVIIRSFKQRPVCSECQMRSLSGPVSDKKFKKLFDIDPKFYETSAFLRDIRYQYSLYQNLTEKQIAAFKRVVDEFKNPKKKQINAIVPKAPTKEEQAEHKQKRAKGLFQSERSTLRALRTK
ncbi:hypothetical protein HY641_04345 [Candidatus Woesearchaeota archaeon]|nr:hypothetical protein [Candidatus Woesearchaeota archaeon]